MLRTLTLSLLPLVALAQMRPTVPHPTNVDFSEGEIGEMPPGWHMSQTVLDAGYRAQLRRENCGENFATCVAYQQPARIEAVQAAALMQTFPAAPYLGKWVRFSAWLRMQDPTNGYVHVRMRVDYPNGRTADIYDSSASSVNSPEWQRRDVCAYVSKNASSISIWARYHPGGFAWVAAPSFGIIPDGWDKADEYGVRALIAKFAGLRNAHDGVGVAALYSEDGKWCVRSCVRGRQELERLWSSVTGNVERTIESVDFPGKNIALIHVVAHYEDSGRHHETFVLIKEDGTWSIQLHQAVD